MAIRWRRHLTVAIGLLISAGAMAFFLVKLRGHWGRLGDVLVAANYLYLLPALLCLVLSYVLRVMRWHVFLAPIHAVPYGHLTSAVCIGFMSSCVLPLRAGELIRPYVLSRLSGISLGSAAGTGVGLARVYDLVGACSIIFLTLCLLPGWGEVSHRVSDAPPVAVQETTQQRAEVPPWAGRLREELPWFAGFALLAMAVLVAVAAHPPLALRTAEFVLRPLPAGWRQRLLAAGGSALEALEFLKSPGPVATALGMTLLLWFCYPLSAWYVSEAFGLGLPLAGALLVQSLVTLAVVVPQGPGFIGVYQVAAMVGVELYGVPDGEAAAFATVLWLLHMVPITLVGLALLWGKGFGLGGLVRASRRVAGGGATP